MAKKGQYKKGAKARSIRQRKYNSRPEQKKRRAKRNLHRRKALKAGRVRKGDKSKELDHGDRRSLSYGSTRVISRRANRRKNGRLSKRHKRK